MDKEKEVVLKLKDEVAKNYDLVGVTPGKHKFANFGEIDLCEISLADADNLVDVGFTHLKKKELEKAEAVEVSPKKLS